MNHHESPIVMTMKTRCCLIKTKGTISINKHETLIAKKKKRKKKGSTYITFPWSYSNSGLELNMQTQFLTSFELGFPLLWMIKGSSTCLELLCFPATGRTGPPYHHIPYTPSVHYRYLTLQSNVHFHSYGTSFHKIKLILARNCTSNYSFAPQCGRGNHSFT